MIKDGRGQHKKKVAACNREIIREWLKKNESTTIKGICDGVGMSYITVRKHVDAIQGGE